MRRPIIRRLTKLSTGADAQTVMLDEYPEPVTIFWDRFCALVEDGDATLIEIGMKLAKSEYLLKTQKVTNAGQSVNTVGPGLSTGGYKPFARFTGTAAGETLAFFAFGQVEE